MSAPPSLGDGSVVVVYCQNPKERLWGVILRLDPVGVVLRGLDLSSVEDWLRQIVSDAPATIGPSTVFVPMHRIERIYLDESSGAAEGICDRIRTQHALEIRDVLLAEG